MVCSSLLGHHVVDVRGQILRNQMRNDKPEILKFRERDDRNEESSGRETSIEIKSSIENRNSKN